MTDRPFWFFPVVAAWAVLFVPAVIVAPFAVFLAGRPDALVPFAVILWLSLPVTFGGSVVGMLASQRKTRPRAVRWWAAAPGIHLALLAGLIVIAEVVAG